MRESVAVRRRQEKCVSLPLIWLEGCADVIRDSGALRILACLNAGSGWRADWTGCVSIREKRALFGELVQIGCVVKRAPVASEITLTKIINEEENDIGFRVRR